MKTFRYVYGIKLGATTEQADITLQHKPLSTTEGQRVALMTLRALMKSGAIRSILDTHGQKNGRYRRGWVGTSKEELTFRKPKGPPSSGIV